MCARIHMTWPIIDACVAMALRRGRSDVLAAAERTDGPDGRSGRTAHHGTAQDGTELHGTGRDGTAWDGTTCGSMPGRDAAAYPKPKRSATPAEANSIHLPLCKIRGRRQQQGGGGVGWGASSTQPHKGDGPISSLGPVSKEQRAVHSGREARVGLAKAQSPSNHLD